ncbi:MAG: hypothetical protein RR370_02800 [Synergistaceae bacterium]
MAKSTLSESQKNRVYQLYKDDNFSQSKLADLFDVSQGTVSRVIKDKTYEAQIEHQQQMMENAMAKGVQSEISKTNSCPLPSGYLKD